MYDEAQTSAVFREQAEQADREFRSSPDGDQADSVLARSCVYGYLYDRYFLETRDLLLNELRWLRRGGKPRPPRQVRSAVAFEAARDALLDHLIEHYSTDGDT